MQPCAPALELGAAPLPLNQRGLGFPRGQHGLSLQVQQSAPAKGISFPPGTAEMKGRRGLLRLLRAAVLKLQVTTRLKPSGELLNGSRRSVDFSGARPWGRTDQPRSLPSPALPTQPDERPRAQRAPAAPALSVTQPPCAEALYPQRPL